MGQVLATEIFGREKYTLLEENTSLCHFAMVATNSDGFAMLGNARFRAFLRLLILTVGSTAGVTAVQVYHVTPIEAVTATSALITLCLTALEYQPERSLLLSLYQSARSVFLLFIFALVIIALISIEDLNDVVKGHSNPQVQAKVSAWLYQILTGFAALLGMIVLLTLYGFWKFSSTRFAESRLGVLKDILIRVENQLADHEISIQERKEAATRVSLNGLITLLSLSPWDSLIKCFRIFRRYLGSSHAYLFVPDFKLGAFRAEAVAHSDTPPAPVVDFFKGTLRYHFPAFLKECMYRDAIQESKAQNPRNWLKAFIQRPDRHQFVSACGWIGAKREILFSQNARLSPVFDHSFTDDIHIKDDISRNASHWLETGSFIGCPVWPRDNGMAAVLLVEKNICGGFIPEDQEVVIAVSEILGRIRSAKE